MVEIAKKGQSKGRPQPHYFSRNFSWHVWVSRFSLLFVLLLLLALLAVCCIKMPPPVGGRSAW
jgi:hypothetical protein